MRLRAVLRAFIDFGLSEPDRYKITFMADISPYVRAASFLEQGKIGQRLREIVRQRVSEVLKESGQASDIESVAQALWAHGHGIVSLLIARPDFPWVERNKLIETSLDLSLKGLLR